MTFIPIRIKLLGAFLGLLLPVLGVSLLSVSRIQTRQTQYDTRVHLEVTRIVFNNILRFRRKSLSSSMGVLIKDPAFQKALAGHDEDAIRGQARSARQRIGAAALWVTDEKGRLLCDTDETMPVGKSMKSMPAVAGVLDGVRGDAVELIGDTAFQLVAEPVRSRRLLGVMIATFPIDDAFAAEIKRLSLSEISFAAGGRVIGSTLDKQQRRTLSDNLGVIERGRTYVIGSVGQRQVVLQSKISRDVNAYIQRSWEEALAPLAKQQRAVALIGLAAFALSVVAGFLLAESFTVSISELHQATQRLVSGDYDVRVDLRQHDEIGQLGKDFNSLVEALQEREKIRGLLHKVVSKEIADELMKPGQLNLGGEEKTISILFADIRGFASISEGLAAPDLVGQLNAYFLAMTRAIDANGGIIDKYMGDAIMALFGAPLATQQDADNALRAALSIVGALERHNRERASRGLPAWRNGVGINTGLAVAGTMGSEDRWAYTVIGDSVNIGSRLEGLTKFYGVSIVASGATKAAAKGPFLFRSLDLVRVRGKNEPVQVFELMGEGVPAPAWLEPFEAGVAAYRTGDFAAAKARFETVLAQKPEDAPTRLYLRRLGPLLVSVPQDWDPAHSMLEK